MVASLSRDQLEGDFGYFLLRLGPNDTPFHPHISLPQIFGHQLHVMPSTSLLLTSNNICLL